ncbi:single-strand DNA-binding protein [Desulfobaculum xiamenense]|uniref:Single-stranded DNA-binding protein n=1 Tax=Desulfobaculum xiamenense TaxID=995050 RepID=A0A846QM41_9BACT|nr:single-stranded DNA-binding protein [Desulfobaculum xiamenense]NJB67522.1 single-strand DNA-binding protein [Desulfobaculum xiamenense]
MPSLNRASIIGRLGRDPELRYTRDGQPVTTLSVATDDSYTNQHGERVERTQWHRVTIFGRQAEPCANHLSKGSLVYVEGSLNTSKWQAQDGSDRYTTEIRAQRVQFLDSPRKREQNAADGGRQACARQGGSHGTPESWGEEDLGPAFPSEASGMDDVPF